MDAYQTGFLPNDYFAASGGAPPPWLGSTEGPFSGLAMWSDFSRATVGQPQKTYAQSLL